MYVQHFGFSRPLFADGIAQDEAVFKTEATQRLEQELELALSRRDAVAILAGESGTGKTTLATDALKNIGTRLAFTCISQPPLTAHELLEQLLTDFGFEPYKKSRVERLQLWRQFLSEMTATDTRVCLLVENVEKLTTEVTLALQSLTAADAALSPGANIVVTSAEPLETLLVGSDTQALNQRVRLRRRIDPLTESEVDDYLRFKCRLGSVDATRIFDNGAGRTLHEFSNGIIRVIDNLLESALISAAQAQEPTLRPERITEVAESQFGMRRMAAAEIDELLEESHTESDLPKIDPADIPTLTDSVKLLVPEVFGRRSMQH